MKATSLNSSSEDVLYAFSVEPVHDRQTLERYLKNYPEYAGELVDLSRELSRKVKEDTEPLAAEDSARINAAWKRHVSAAPSRLSNPFASLTHDRLREIAQSLDVPRQVITAFRERKVIAESVPGQFLGRLAESLNTSVSIFIVYLKQAQQPRFAGSYKADDKPQSTKCDNFEKVLIDAGVPENKRLILLSDD